MDKFFGADFSSARQRDLEAKAGSLDWPAHRRFLQRTRYRPMFDRAFGALLQEKAGPCFAFQKNLKQEFLEEFDRWLHGSRLNSIRGLDAFPARDFISGVTHSLDDLHVAFAGRIVCLEHEYSYHRRLRADLAIRSLSTLQRDDVLVMSMPFSYCGDVHPETHAILERCLELGIPVHIDSAWMGCTRGIEFDYGHPAIHTASFSLSKGLGLGSHRVGVRYARVRHPGPVAVVNDFQMEVNSVMSCGILFMKEFGSDYLQERYGAAYALVCRELSLRPTKAIHVAYGEVEGGEWWPLGVRPFLRYLVDDLNEFHGS